MKNGLVKETVFGTCCDLTYEGFGVLKHGKDVLFVAGMFPGEEGEVQIEYRRAGQIYGKVKKLTKISPSRINPECKICSACGGCVFQ